MELVRCTQALAVDGVQAVHGGAVGGLAVGNRLQTQIGPAVVEACVAIVGGVLRAFAHATLPLVGEQPVQCGVARIGMYRRYQREEQEQKGHKSHKSASRYVSKVYQLRPKKKPQPGGCGFGFRWWIIRN